MTYRFESTVRGRLPRPSDDSGSIAMLLLVIVVGAAIGSLLMAMVVSQSNATRFSASRVRSLDAAQAGLDVMLGQLRGATSTGTDNTTYGDADRLPCVPQSTPLKGPANASGTLTYQVWVAYYRTDPSLSAAQSMTCSSGYGPFDAASGSHTPRYARITSFGVDSSNPNSASKGRTLTTTYLFQIDDVNIPGGQIQLFPDTSGNKWCMGVNTSAPIAGTTVVLLPCSAATPAPPQQVWAYRSDLSIQLVSSMTTAQPTGLCLDTSPTTHSTSDLIVLNACNAAGTAAWNQRWSINDNAHLEGTKQTLPSDSTSGKDGFCIAAGSQTNLQGLTLATCKSGTADTAQTWVPSATAGAGASGATLHNITNYQKFATCIDVTGGDPNASYLILYSCKQDPVPSSLRWNQVFTQALGPPSATAGPLTTNLAMADKEQQNNVYCLQPPVNSGGYVTLSSACSSTWTWYQAKSSTGASLPYAQVYTIVDSAGRCLAPGSPTDLSTQYFKVVVTACDGSTAQKWNADPSVLAARLTATGEK